MPKPTRVSRSRSTAALLVVLLAASSCTDGTRDQARTSADARRYAPHARDITITTVPLLVKEEQSVLPPMMSGQLVVLSASSMVDAAH